jgi:hypothetical protein
VTLYVFGLMQEVPGFAGPLAMGYFKGAIVALGSNRSYQREPSGDQTTRSRRCCPATGKQPDRSPAARCTILGRRRNRLRVWPAPITTSQKALMVKTLIKTQEKIGD